MVMCHSPSHLSDGCSPVNGMAALKICSFAPEPPKENEVHEILRANLERANELGLNDVDLTPRPPSRRKTDYWTLLIVGNLGFAGLALLLSRNMVTLVFAGSGMVLFSLGVTWIMWFVMDNY